MATEEEETGTRMDRIGTRIRTRAGTGTRIRTREGIGTSRKATPREIGTRTRMETGMLREEQMAPMATGIKEVVPITETGTTTKAKAKPITETGTITAVGMATVVVVVITTTRGIPMVIGIRAKEGIGTKTKDKATGTKTVKATGIRTAVATGTKDKPEDTIRDREDRIGARTKEAKATGTKAKRVTIGDRTRVRTGIKAAKHSPRIRPRARLRPSQW